MLKNALLVCVTLSVCLLIGEVALRAFTPFPVGWLSNRVLDDRLGYKLDPITLNDVDANGFRNAEGAFTNYQVAFLGDSHVFSENVERHDSLPAVFEDLTDIPTYNFGVGSYGVLSYHALAVEALEKGKQVIIGLYPTNDFTASNSFCYTKLDTDPFWQQELLRLEVSFSDAKKVCQENIWWYKNTQNWRASLTTFLRENVALVSAFDTLIWDEINRMRRQSQQKPSNEYDLPKVRITERRVDNTTRSSLIDSPAREEIFTFFQKSIFDLRERAAPGQLGVLLIPSRAQVYAEWVRRNYATSEIPQDFLSNVVPQNTLNVGLMTFLSANNIPVYSAIEAMAVALDTSLKSTGKDIYPLDDGHPKEQGYRAYALAAQKLHQEMQSLVAQAETTQ